MLLQALPLVFVLAGLVLYTVLGGADFGAGFWQLFAGRGERAEQVRGKRTTRCCAAARHFARSSGVYGWVKSTWTTRWSPPSKNVDSRSCV